MNTWREREPENQTVDMEKAKRIIAILVALTLWGLSTKFSVAGFGASIDAKEIWIGYVLSFCITAIQLIWNGMRDKTNLTLWSAGMLSYGYGIFTNVVGILFWQGYNFEDLSRNLLLIIFPLVLGLFLEIVPEPLITWALTGDHKSGDFLGNLLGNNLIPNSNKNKSINFKENGVPTRNNNNKKQKSNFQPSHRPQWPPKNEQKKFNFRETEKEYLRSMEDPELYRHGLEGTGMERPNW